MKNIKNIIISLFVILSIIFINACTQTTEKKVKFSTEETTINLFVGDSYSPQFKVENLETYEFGYVYDKTVISIRRGVISALKKGEWEVEVYIKNRKDIESIKFTVIVDDKPEEIKPESFECEEVIKVYLNEIYELDIKVFPDGTSSKLKCISYDSKVATCNENGIIIPVGVGQTYILIKLSENLNVSKRILVIVERPPVESIKLMDSISLNYFQTYTLTRRSWSRSYNYFF